MAIVILAGPSGSGKSATALEIAELWKQKHPGKPAEILCADSITVYRGCNIGAAKPTPQEQARVPHQLLDLRNPDQDFTAADFVAAADPILQRLEQNQGLALLVGGTGFYLRALIQGMTDQDEELSAKSEAVKAALVERAEREGMDKLYAEMLARDPALASKIHANDHYRIVRALQAMETTGRRWSELNDEARARPPRYPHANFYCLSLPKPVLAERVHRRTLQMLQDGFLNEVEELLAQYPPTAKALQSVGYHECLEYLGRIPSPEAPRSLERLAEKITQGTLRLAKRQLTWFRGERNVEWLEAPRAEDFLPTLSQRLGLT